MRTSRRLVATAVISAASALVLLGCTAATDTRSESSAPPSTPTSEASAAPSPSATIDIPEEPVTGEIASAVSDRLATPPSSSSVSGPGLMVADRPFSIEGECIGTRADYSLTTADPADAGRVLVEGAIECSAPMKSSVGSTAGYARGRAAGVHRHRRDRPRLAAGRPAVAGRAERMPATSDAVSSVGPRNKESS